MIILGLLVSPMLFGAGMVARAPFRAFRSINGLFERLLSKNFQGAA